MTLFLATESGDSIVNPRQIYMNRNTYKPIRTAEEFKLEFSRIKRIRHFYTAGETRYLAGELEMLLDALDVRYAHLGRGHQASKIWRPLKRQYPL